MNIEFTATYQLFFSIYKLKFLINNSKKRMDIIMNVCIYRFRWLLRYRVIELKGGFFHSDKAQTWLYNVNNNRHLHQDAKERRMSY